MFYFYLPSPYNMTASVAVLQSTEEKSSLTSTATKTTKKKPMVLSKLSKEIIMQSKNYCTDSIRRVKSAGHL